MKKRLTKPQMKRIALAVEAHYLVSGADTACVREHLFEGDDSRFTDIQWELAMKWFKQAGFTEPVTNLQQIFLTILGPDYRDYFFTDPCTDNGYGVQT